MAVPLTAREPVEFTPLTLPERFTLPDPENEARRVPKPDPDDPTKPMLRVIVRVPTYVERDSYASALVRAGVITYQRKQIRDISLAGVEVVLPDQDGEEVRALLTELWQVSDAEAEAQEKQLERLAEIHEIAKAKAKGDPAKEAPDPQYVADELAKIRASMVMDPQRRARAVGFNQEIMVKFQPLRDALGSLADQDSKRAYMNARTYVQGWVGLEHSPDGNGRGGLLEHEIEYLRGELGSDAFDELSDFITAMQGIDGDEEKNLASLLESMSARIGSTQSTTGPSSDDGNSTDEPSTSTPATTGSPKTTERSSASSKSSPTRTGGTKSKSGRTGARSSTSPSS